MKEKVKKFFSEIFVNTYDYPFIIGFLEANGIYGIVPSLKKEGTKTCVNYEMFKNWWKQNYEQKKTKCADGRVDNGMNRNSKSFVAHTSELLIKSSLYASSRD